MTLLLSNANRNITNQNKIQREGRNSANFNLLKKRKDVVNTPEAGLTKNTMTRSNILTTHKYLAPNRHKVNAHKRSFGNKIGDKFVSKSYLSPNASKVNSQIVLYDKSSFMEY